MSNRNGNHHRQFNGFEFLTSSANRTQKQSPFARIFMIVLMLTIVFCYPLNILLSKVKSNKQYVYQFEPHDLTPRDGITFSMSVTKQWTDQSLHPATPMGAQYDGVLTLDGTQNFRNWTVTIAFNEAPIIDSSWNGQFDISGNNLTFTPDDDTTMTFGAVMYSRQLLTPTGYSITGYYVVNPHTTPLYFITIGLFILWIILITTQILTYFRTRSLLQRQAASVEIINQAMQTFASFIDAKDSYTRGHSQRVSAYSVEIAFRMGLESESISHIYYTSMLHDCGKIGISDAVLKKRAGLNDEEYALIREHTVIGANMLRNFTAVPGIQDGAHYHHERYDGKGYPEGLRGEQIPLFARIICIADAFDAMNSNRCYRGCMEMNVIIAELRENAGKQFDPNIIGYMIEMVQDGFVDAVQKQYPFSFTENK